MNDKNSLSGELIMTGITDNDYQVESEHNAYNEVCAIAVYLQFPRFSYPIW